MEFIESTKNKRIKEWKKLLQTRGRKKANRYLIEGFHLIEEAQKSEAIIEQIIVREDVWEKEWKAKEDKNSVVVSEEVALELSDTESSQGIFAVIQKEEKILSEKIEAPYLLLDAVQDPGNVGTMIRSADAAGFSGVILGEGTVDAYNPKTLRSAQGSHFHLELVEESIESAIKRLHQQQVQVYGTALDERAKPYNGKQFSEPFGLIVGNEGAGVRQDILASTDANFYIPIKGQAESLNVSIAASILMFSLYQT